MKRIVFFAVLLIALVLLLAVPRPPKKNAPQFMRFQTAPSAQSSNLIGYDFFSSRPFEGGRMWIRAGSSATEPQRYWLLDLEKNSASRMGDLPQRPNFTFEPSPDFHYGYTPLQGTGLDLPVYCFDFKKRSVNRLHVHGWPSGWWDHRNILVLRTNQDFVLHDVTADRASPLISSQRIAAFLRENMISDDPTKTQAFFIWNGRENNFYLTDTHQKWAAAESFLIKLDRPDGTLKLLARLFKFEWSDHFDPDGRYYLFSGRGPGTASDGVFLRDMQSGTNQTLVIPAGDRYFSIPRFYRDSIIYIRSNRLWRISLDGTKNAQIFPP